MFILDKIYVVRVQGYTGQEICGRVQGYNGQVTCSWSLMICLYCTRRSCSLKIF